MPTERNADPSDRPSDFIVFQNSGGERLAIPYYHIIGIELCRGGGEVHVTAGGYSVSLTANDAPSIFDNLVKRHKDFYSPLGDANTGGTTITWQRRGED